MANTNLTIDMITREALRVAHEKLAFIGTVDRQYDSDFAKTGAKIGSTLRVRKPNMYTRRQGSRVMDVQDTTEVNGTITVATQDGVDMRFNSQELALDIDEFSQRNIVPAISSLVSGIEADFLSYCTKAVYNVAGTAGTAISTLSVPNLARAKLNQNLAPKDGQRYVQLDSITSASMVTGLSGLFHDSSAIKEQYREGMLGRTAMADWYENERIWTLTNTADVTCTMAAAAAVTDGGSVMTMASLSVAPATGAVFTIPGIYQCHPETKASLGILQQFVVTAGTTTIQTVAPAMYLTGPRQNLCDSTGAQLTVASFNGTSLVPVFQGLASTAYVQPLMYHKEAFQFVTADLPLMDDAHKCVRRVQDGLSLRVWQASDIRNDELLTRIDILYGMAALRPEWACRMIGAANA